VAKAKQLLMGRPPTEAEVTAVAADPGALGPMVDEWMATPQYQVKMIVLLGLLFEQSQLNDSTDFLFILPLRGTGSGPNIRNLIQNIRESMARTVLALDAQGKPLTDAYTTDTFMMTPALMEYEALLDSYSANDHGYITDSYPPFTLKFEVNAGPIPFSETLDPTSPNYMTFYNTAAVQQNGCTMDPYVVTADSFQLHLALYGTIQGQQGTPCHGVGDANSSVFTAADFTTWKPVKIRRPVAGEQTTQFFNVPALRSANELVLNSPHVGFFTTTAFKANWQTNASNSMRVTANQALIVATGMAIDGSDFTSPPTTPGLDAEHAAPGTACFGCHQMLDPIRSIFASNFSWYYGPQDEASFRSQPGLFAFGQVIAPMSTLADFGAILAGHPAVAAAWTQKLCYTFDSAPCATDDPEFQRIVSDFKNSNYSLKRLVRDLITSPITTHTTSTPSALAAGEVVPVLRRDHLCLALGGRMGFADLCGLSLMTKLTAARGVISAIASGLPSDGYGRGSTAPVLPNNPSLFFRAGIETICQEVATLVIDVPADPNNPNLVRWSSAQPDAAIADFVSIIMGLVPSDPRAAQAAVLLHGHFMGAMQGGATAQNALRSTLMVACMSPGAVALGL
jgi:hypothetical protein